MNKISTYRKQLGLSQRQFATHLGWIQSRLANYEANFAHPDWRSAEKLLPHLTIWDLAVFLMMFSRLM